ncbi:MAG: molybdopterin biosynthesis protein [Desulfatiglans sp.]|jgi:putative molybdopterin biosynthesis protein|nr:molybdopterin biosynthesis protein [Desulfatiglans sp.]
MKRNVYLDLKTLKDAREIFFKRWESRKSLPEIIDVDHSLGRVTAEPVFARLSAPSYHAAAMDGIAVRAEDTYDTTEKNPKTLKIGKDALWSNTGQPLPKDYNAIIMVEKLHQIDEETIEIMSPAYPWQNIRKVGEDIVATQLLLPQNHMIRPYDMGALISAGIIRISVRRRPVVTIIPTGTELVSLRDIGENMDSLSEGQIIESNSVTLSALVAESHGIPVVKGIIPDNMESIRNALISASESEADMIIINAGSSAGSKDYTAGIIAELGIVHVHGVAMMPGKPTILGEINDKPVIGNPGYTVSAVLSFDQFVKPLLHSMQDIRLKNRKTIAVQPSRNIPSKLGTEEFLRVNIGSVGGKMVATPLPRAAGSVTTLTRAEGIIRIPALSEGITQEEEVEAELLVDDEELKNTIVIIGSHDITLDIISDEIRKEGKDIRVSSGNVGSLGGLMAIKKGVCHLGGSHLLDEETGEYNLSYIRKYLKGIKVSLFHLVMRDQGLIVKKGNPKGIKGVEDLLREDISFMNRQAGSGTRILFDYKLKQSGYAPSQIKGYDHEEYTHMAVAVDVLSGAADCGMGIYAAAKALDLEFIPIVREQYDLIIPSEHLKNQNIAELIKTIGTDSFRKRVTGLGGYDPSKSGDLWVELG